MGSATVEGNSQRNINTNFDPMQRPMFYPCADCGLKFTKRALEIHKRSCTESENCVCVVCKISKNKLSSNKDRFRSGSSPLKCKIAERTLKHVVRRRLRLTKQLMVENKKFKFSQEYSPEKNSPTKSYLSIPNFIPSMTINDFETPNLSPLLPQIDSPTRNPKFVEGSSPQKISRFRSILPALNGIPLVPVSDLQTPDLTPLLPQVDSPTQNPNHIVLPQIDLPNLNSNPIISNQSVQNGSTSPFKDAFLLIDQLEDQEKTSCNVENDLKDMSCTVANEVTFSNVSSNKCLFTNEVEVQSDASNDTIITDDNFLITNDAVVLVDENSEGTLLIDEQSESLNTDINNERLAAVPEEAPLNISSDDSSALDEKHRNLPFDESSLDIIDKLHGTKPCNRRMFCACCGDHIEWKFFSAHVLTHVKAVGNHFGCPLCNDSRSTPTYFLMHFYSHISNHPPECEKCRCDTPDCLESYAQPLPEHCYAESTDHRCYVCLRPFIHFQSLVNHMKLHSGETPFSCRECSRTFRHIGNLQRHMSVHRGERPFKCDKCCRSFADPATLRNHTRVHTKETPYVCNHCNRGFSQVGNLKRHMALHVQKGVRESYVKVLDQQKMIMKKVDRRIPETQPPGTIKPRQRGRKRSDRLDLHICTKCGKKYTWKHDLEIHFRTHTGEKPYHCDLCMKRFAQSGAVRIHKIRHHATPDQIKERMMKKQIKAMPPFGVWISK